ncbi:DUF3718 domain-containing protein [Aestuariibacter halophilus]|uniref:DUF3718 domain-containing protein n=1 Tax=Fluctibacter halophilus TaxID=226011 RepID=A0ABS8G966_9ALTE|nr:DUF3718 domain-containing protein [Aestuariibacter halophilus]MCC2617114.1 DUF3718 domain-containing protein [Aestuariibacter halophilus]
MFKCVKASLAIATLSLIAAPIAHAGVEDALQNICTIVKADDKAELRKKMKAVETDYRLKLQDYYNGISCGGDSLIRHAFVNNAVEAGTLLIKKMPKSQLNAPETDGQTLRAWVSDKGLMDTPLAAVLNERI